MVNREVWEENVKEVRQGMLHKVSDPDFRRMTACIIDSFSDQLFEKIDQKMALILEKDYMSLASKAVQRIRNDNPDEPDSLESMLISFSLEVRDDIFYPEKED